MKDNLILTGEEAYLFQRAINNPKLVPREEYDKAYELFYRILPQLPSFGDVVSSSVNYKQNEKIFNKEFEAVKRAYVFIKAYMYKNTHL